MQEGDLIISKDANIGEAAILDKNYSNYTLSGALYKLPITKNKFYLFAFLKHHFFRSQLDLLVPKGSTIRHAKTLFLDCKIPFPNQKNANEIIKYVELLVQAVINKEKEIRRKNQLIFDLIEQEISENQKENKFEYKTPKFNELILNLRIDSGYYCHDYKEKQFKISNYKYGAATIDKWKFEIKRGQNLQISQIGKSIYSDKSKENFYTTIKPTNFSEFGTVKKFEYLGNPKKLQTIKKGDIVITATGTVGKCIHPKEKWITNIQGIVLKKKDNNIRESAFISCFLRFLRYWGVLDYISVGGQGGSLAQKYWKDILIPNFSEQKQQEISSLYYNPKDYPKNLNLENFLQNDQSWNQQAGILELDKLIKKIKEHLNKILDKIVNDEKVEANFNF
ncbi:MAG: restriction endonuclease subunit S [Candidatus Moeniiplasma glomeromycotorum]|nr:restriction endonuclease subunit S [Candidatus Moeniiplasma glomeromycotorum]MCE8167974.1 restriction endonuclease subunit S [Candidatus Moeniiplasma glomeromycotorum]MCE8169191.1 restriction endonuclease subunit S [Candidatus Moeniiplasma glomeromycotorum]